MQATVHTTQSMDPVDRADAWRDINTRYFGQLQTEALSAAPLDATAEVYPLGAMRLFLLEAPAHRIARQKSRTHFCPESVADQYYKLVLQLSGRAQIDQGQRSHQLMPGNWSLYDPQQSYSITNWEACRLLVLQIPRTELSGFRVPELHNDEAHDPNLRGLSSVLSSFLISLSQQVGVLPEAVGSPLSDSVMGLLATTLQAKQQAGQSPHDLPSVMRCRVKQYVQAHLSEPDLTPSRIAQDLRCSKRYLHQVFEGDTLTLDRFIWHRRVVHCASSLQAAESQHKTIAEIAYAAGFSSSAHFCRVFKEQMGVSPSELRKQLT